MSNRIDLSDKKFGKLKVLSYSHTNKKRAFYFCKCDCGQEAIVQGNSLKNGDTKSCGCLKKRLGNGNPLFTGYKNIGGKFWGHIKFNAKSRNLEFDIKIEKAWELFIKQKQKCALSGELLIFESKSQCGDGTAYLDRIDSSKGYVLDNVQWVHKDVNMMKKDMTDSKFVGWCKKIALISEKEG